MSSQSKLRQSRERWKLKASTRADDNRYLRKELARVKNERDKLKKKDANRIAARLPALCGQVTEEDARRVLDVSVAQQKEVMGSLSSLTRQRRQVLSNPGSLDNMILSDTDQNLELIPMSRNRSKSPIILNISEYYTKTNDPVISLKNRDMDHARNRPLELTMAG